MKHKKAGPTVSAVAVISIQLWASAWSADLLDLGLQSDAHWGKHNGCGPLGLWGARDLKERGLWRHTLSVMQNHPTGGRQQRMDTQCNLWKKRSIVLDNTWGHWESVSVKPNVDDLPDLGLQWDVHWGEHYGCGPLGLWDGDWRTERGVTEPYPPCHAEPSHQGRQEEIGAQCNLWMNHREKINCSWGSKIHKKINK